MSRPLLSIVVPTRDRPDTASRCIASVVAQEDADYDYELVISDNSSAGNDELQRWVRGITGARQVRYIRTGGKLEMDANWEFASRQTNGDYLLVLPDRWVMRGGSLRLLSSIIRSSEPECLYWDTNLSMDRHGHLRSGIDPSEPLQCEAQLSIDVLRNLLGFHGYADDTVFTQPFPRGLNSMLRRDVAEAIRGRAGCLFAPHACDYTSGIATLVSTSHVLHLRDSLYLPIGTRSNGQALAVRGLPPQLMNASHWRGLHLDSVLMTVMNDIEGTLRRYGHADLLGEIDEGNFLLSLLNEIHFKEWHGSPLDTRGMKETLFRHAESHPARFGENILERLHWYERQLAPNLVVVRRLLQQVGLFYPTYRAKQRLTELLRASTGESYSEDLFRHRSLVVASRTTKASAE